MDTDSFTVHVKTEDIYKDIAKDVEKGLYTSNFELGRPLSKWKNEKIIELMKDDLGGKIVKEFVGLRAKIYSYLKHNNDGDKKAKGTKKCIMKRKLKFQGYKNCLETSQIENKTNCFKKYKINVDSLKEDQKEFIKNNKLILKTRQRFESERHNIFIEEINKIAWSSNGDKRMQSIGSIETYAYGMNKNLVCKKEEV